MQCGIEALDTPTLRMLKKGMTGPGNLRFLRECCETGVSVLWNLICGIPGEDIRRLYRLLELIPKLFHLYPPTGLWGISYDRNSDYVRRREDYGLSLTPSTAALSNAFPFEARELQQIAYFYENNRISEIMTREKIKLIQKINSEIVRWQNRWKAETRGACQGCIGRTLKINDSSTPAVRRVSTACHPRRPRCSTTCKPLAPTLRARSLCVANPFVGLA